MSDFLTWADIKSAFGLTDSDSQKALYQAAIPGVCSRIEGYTDKTFPVATSSVEWLSQDNAGMAEYYPKNVPIMYVEQACAVGPAIQVTSTVVCWIAISATKVVVTAVDGSELLNEDLAGQDMQFVLDELNGVTGLTAVVDPAGDATYPADNLYPCTYSVQANAAACVMLGGTQPIPVTVKDGLRIDIDRMNYQFPISQTWLSSPSLLMAPQVPVLMIRSTWGYSAVPADLVRTGCEMVRDAVKLASGEIDGSMSAETLSKYSYRLADGVMLGDLLSKYHSALDRYRSVVF